MSILIKGIDMPKSCKECMNNCINIVVDCYPDEDEEKCCPLIEIDDELYEKAVNAYVLQQVRYGNVNNH